MTPEESTALYNKDVENAIAWKEQRLQEAYRAYQAELGAAEWQFQTHLADARGRQKTRDAERWAEESAFLNET